MLIKDLFRMGEHSGCLAIMTSLGSVGTLVFFRMPFIGTCPYILIIRTPSAIRTSFFLMIVIMAGLNMSDALHRHLSY